MRLVPRLIAGQAYVAQHVIRQFHKIATAAAQFQPTFETRQSVRQKPEKRDIVIRLPDMAPGP